MNAEDAVDLIYALHAEIDERRHEVQELCDKIDDKLWQLSASCENFCAALEEMKEDDDAE